MLNTVRLSLNGGLEQSTSQLRVTPATSSAARALSRFGFGLLTLLALAGSNPAIYTEPNMLKV